MKLYLRTNGNVSEQASAYQKVFGGTILKQSYMDSGDAIDGALKASKESHEYIYMKFATGDKVMIGKHQQGIPLRGFNADIIIDCPDQKSFEDSCEKLKAHSAFTLTYDVSKYGPITIAKFADK